jgi:hypothetical protein
MNQVTTKPLEQDLQSFLALSPEDRARCFMALDSFKKVVVKTKKVVTKYTEDYYYNLLVAENPAQIERNRKKYNKNTSGISKDTCSTKRRCNAN